MRHHVVLRLLCCRLLFVVSGGSVVVDEEVQAESGYVSAVYDARREVVYFLPFASSAIGVLETKTWSFRRSEASFGSKQYHGGCMSDDGSVHLAPYAGSAPIVRWRVGADARAAGPGNESAVVLSTQSKAFVGCVAVGSRVLYLPGAAEALVVATRRPRPPVESSGANSSTVALAFIAEDDAVKYVGGVALKSLVYLIPREARSLTVVDVESAAIVGRVAASRSYAAAAVWDERYLVAAPSSESGVLGVFDVVENVWVSETRLPNATVSSVVVSEDLAVMPSYGHMVVFSLRDLALRDMLPLRETATEDTEDLLEFFPYAGGVVVDSESAVFAPYYATTVGRVSFLRPQEAPEEDTKKGGQKDDNEAIPWRGMTYAVIYAVLVGLSFFFFCVAKKEPPRNNSIFLVGLIELSSATFFVAELWMTRYRSLAVANTLGLAVSTLASLVFFGRERHRKSGLASRRGPPPAAGRRRRLRRGLRPLLRDGLLAERAPRHGRRHRAPPPPELLRRRRPRGPPHRPPRLAQDDLRHQATEKTPKNAHADHASP